MINNIFECSGIYKITCKANGKIYIGSAVKFKERLRLHKLTLKLMKHPNIHLQRAHDKYGLESFTFEPILVCAEADLLMYEQLCIDGYDAYRTGFNRAPKAGSNLGLKWTEESRLKLSKAKKGVTNSWTEESRRLRKESFDNNPNNKNHGEKISKALKGKTKPEGFAKSVSDTKRGVKASEAHKEALKASWAIRKNDSIWFSKFKKKQSENQKKQTHMYNEAYKAKMSEASLRAWAKRKKALDNNE